ncbi:protein of unknown function [Kyrpidia spormannii]|uniref:Cytochrome c oxidase subunit IIa n=2 Tax=Kyrpidia spormannii TaxID=2055160 RepID=A0ACA8Z4H8_9BACL|nr:Putative cytochrome c oxidase subunit IIa [Kyrpidia spormannii]CAB3389666.1 protein of unknown function [Kyrpidia spormannii]
MLTRSRLRVLPCGHLSNLEQPLAVNRAILEFVTDMDEYSYFC